MSNVTVSVVGYRDAAEPVKERVDDLLARMTLEEKVAQLTGVLSFDLLGPTGLDEQAIRRASDRGNRTDLGRRVAVARPRPVGLDAE